MIAMYRKVRPTKNAWAGVRPSPRIEISARGLRKTTKETGLDRKTIRGILNGKKVKASTLAKVVSGLQGE
jgi:hypothetical protein